MDEDKQDKTGEKVSQGQRKFSFIQFTPNEKPIAPDIDVVRYSNQVLINVSENDVMLDFLELPGIIRDGEMCVRGTRIYLTHNKAKNFYEVLGKLLEKNTP